MATWYGRYGADEGATVDTMALAVEGCGCDDWSVACVQGVIELSHGQYALQKKKPLVPLMLVEGYEADGWPACCWGFDVVRFLRSDAIERGCI